MKELTVLSISCVVVCLGCSMCADREISSEETDVLRKGEDVRTLVLQYRIWMDAVAPSQFVAVYEDGMTLGLKVRWKLQPAEKEELDDLIARLEAEEINGQEFIAKGRWIREGFELEVYDIEKKP